MAYASCRDIVRLEVKAMQAGELVFPGDYIYIDPVTKNILDEDSEEFENKDCSIEGVATFVEYCAKAEVLELKFDYFRGGLFAYDVEMIGLLDVIDKDLPKIIELITKPESTKLLNHTDKKLFEINKILNSTKVFHLLYLYESWMSDTPNGRDYDSELKLLGLVDLNSLEYN